MKTILFDKLIFIVATALFIWEVGLGAFVQRMTSPAPAAQFDPTLLMDFMTSPAPAVTVSGCRVPITRMQKTSNGTSFGWLFDQGLVADVNRSASYEEAALADSDGDGISNGAEYITGTNPKQSNSFFRVQASGTLLSWPAVTGRVYEVLRTDRLSEPFTNAASVEFPSNTFSASAGFYRVHVRLK